MTEVMSMLDLDFSLCIAVVTEIVVWSMFVERFRLPKQCIRKGKNKFR